MSTAVQISISLLLGYLVGTINPAFIISKLKGFDIRKTGSRNAGGSNAVITMGKTVGLFCIFFDIFKAYMIIRVMVTLFPTVKCIYACTAMATIIGHMYPILMGFKGGKGLACLGGSMLAYNWKIFLIILGVELLLAFIVNYICVVPITASIAFPVIYGALESYWVGTAVFFIATIAMLYKHIENLKRIRQGTELHFSYLWHKDEEKDRISENIKKIDETQLASVFRDRHKKK